MRIANPMANPPEWLHQLADEVSASVCAVDVMSPLGCHIHRAQEHWEVTLFASATEVMGGPLDGKRRPSRFFLDIQGVTQVFDRIRSVVWQAHGLGASDDVGPHLSVEGDYRGHPVWLRIPALAPRQFPVGRIAHVHEATWEEVW
jgi:hypothetical protein